MSSSFLLLLYHCHDFPLAPKTFSTFFYSPFAQKSFLIFFFIYRWFSHCLHANLNGRYNLGLTWYDLSRNEWVAVKNTIMMITKRHECLSPSEDLYDSSSSEINDSSPTKTTRSPI